MGDSDMPPPSRTKASWLSEKTWVPISFVVFVLGVAMMTSNFVHGVDQKFTRQEFTNDRLLQQIAGQSERMEGMVTREEFRAREAAWNAWVELLRARAAPEMRGAIPDPPK